MTLSARELVSQNRGLCQRIVRLRTLVENAGVEEPRNDIQRVSGVVKDFLDKLKNITKDQIDDQGFFTVQVEKIKGINANLDKLYETKFSAENEPLLNTSKGKEGILGILNQFNEIFSPVVVTNKQYLEKCIGILQMDRGNLESFLQSASVPTVAPTSTDPEASPLASRFSSAASSSSTLLGQSVTSFPVEAASTSSVVTLQPDSTTVISSSSLSLASKQTNAVQTVLPKNPAANVDEKASDTAAASLTALSSSSSAAASTANVGSSHVAPPNAATPALAIDVVSEKDDSLSPASGAGEEKVFKARAKVNDQLLHARMKKLKERMNSKEEEAEKGKDEFAWVDLENSVVKVGKGSMSLKTWVQGDFRPSISGYIIRGKGKKEGVQFEIKHKENICICSTTEANLSAAIQVYKTMGVKALEAVQDFSGVVGDNGLSQRAWVFCLLTKYGMEVHDANGRPVTLGQLVYKGLSPIYDDCKDKYTDKNTANQAWRKACKEAEGAYENKCREVLQAMKKKLTELGVPADVSDAVLNKINDKPACSASITSSEGRWPLSP